MRNENYVNVRHNRISITQFEDAVNKKTLFEEVRNDAI